MTDQGWPCALYGSFRREFTKLQRINTSHPPPSPTKHWKQHWADDSQTRDTGYLLSDSTPHLDQYICCLIVKQLHLSFPWNTDPEARHKLYFSAVRLYYWLWSTDPTVKPPISSTDPPPMWPQRVLCLIKVFVSLPFTFFIPRLVGGRYILVMPWSVRRQSHFFCGCKISHS